MNCELLAPAGNIECVYAAINSGADAIYAGADRFSARAYAGNLGTDDFISALRISHLHGVRVYLALNTLINTSEYEDAYETIRPLYESGLDGIIIQDTGLIPMISEHFPDLKMHASTQMSIMNSEGASLLASYGFTRVVPARELTLDEVRNIKAKTGLEIECFIHGAMCYSYSGMCLMSSMIGGRSGNRGRCAGTCRLPFRTILDGRDIDPRSAGSDTYPLSMKDMCTIDILPELIDAGIDSFKIEGRMKSPEYVAGVTSMYRKYMDMYAGAGRNGFDVDDRDRKLLTSLYIRTGLSHGYYEGERGRLLVTMDSPGYNGNDPDYEKKIHEKYVHECDRIPCDIYSYIHAGSEVTLTLGCDDTYVTVGSSAAQEADRAPLTEESVNERLSKLGSTPFCAGSVNTDLGDNAFIAVGALNSLRRDAVEKLTRALIEHNGFDYSRISSPHPITAAHPDTPDSRKQSPIRYDISVSTTGQLTSVLSFCRESSPIGRIILDHRILVSDEMSQDIVSGLKDTASDGTQIYVSLPYVFRDNRRKVFADIMDRARGLGFIGGFLVHSIDELRYVSEQIEGSGAGLFHKNGTGQGKTGIITDSHIYVHNPEAVSFVTETGFVTGITYPYELNLKELRLLSHSVSIPAGTETVLTVYGYIPMMITSGCIKNTYSSCDHISETGRRCMLKDRKGKLFPVSTDCLTCTNIIYNERPLSLHGMMEDIRAVNADRYRICLTVENEEESADIVKAFVRYGEKGCGFPADIPVTTGHMKRGAE